MGIKRQSPKQTGRIPVAEPPNDRPLRFSFKYIDLVSNQKFSVSRCEDGYLGKFLGRLKDLEGCRLSEFRGPSHTLRGHKITFTETSEPHGFSGLNAQLRAQEPWQFAISANKHGRVHGFLLDDTFHVVWIDPEHLLYPGH
jgi:hypothetical protein